MEKYLSLKTSLLIAALASFGVGCGGNTMRVVAQRAPHDLECSKESIKIKSLGGTTYAAKGCGREATYMCSGSNFMTDGTCMRER